MSNQKIQKQKQKDKEFYKSYYKHGVSIHEGKCFVISKEGDVPLQLQITSQECINYLIHKM